MEIKNQARKELEEEQKREELKEYKSSKRKRKLGKFIWRIIETIICLFILFETIMGVLDMQRLNEDKEPVWYLDTKVETVEGKQETTYNLGLYVIKKVIDDKEKRISLKPFFIK